MDFAGPLWLGCGPLKLVASLDISQQDVDYAAFVLAGQDLQFWTKKQGLGFHTFQTWMKDSSLKMMDLVMTGFRILFKTQENRDDQSIMELLDSPGYTVSPAA